MTDDRLWLVVTAFVFAAMLGVATLLLPGAMRFYATFIVDGLLEKFK